MNKNSALVIIDVQNDFCAGGVMGAPHDDNFIVRINQLQKHFSCVVASQDWHPINHISFASNHAGHNVHDVIDVNGFPQTLWPDHCVQNSEGAKFHPALSTKHITKIVYKGTDPAVDSYSAFYDNNRVHATGLTDYLRGQQITHVYLAGLVTDYCVKYSALDAVYDGFETTVILDASCAFNAKPDDEKNAIAEMKEQGISFMTSDNIFAADTDI